MPSIPRRPPTAWVALGASLLLLGVALVSSTTLAAPIAASGTAQSLSLDALYSATPSASAAAPPTLGSGAQNVTQTVNFSAVWHGVATKDPPRAPDVMVLPSPPVGAWWNITKIQLTGNFVEKKTFRQSSFLFSRFVQNPTEYPLLADPNLDVLAHLGLDSGKSGTYIGAGGVGASPNSSWDWTQFDQPITLNSEVQIVLGSDLGVGNSVAVTVDYSVLSPGVTVVKWAHPTLNGKTETFELGPPSNGTQWYLENAYANIVACSSSQGRAVTMYLEPGGQLLLKGNDYPDHVSVRNTGGYSAVQTGPALNKYGTQVVWPSQIWLNDTEYISVSFTGQSCDKTMYAVGFTQLAL